MNVQAKIVWGLVGWANERAGLDFYRWDDKIMPRFKTNDGLGDLLALEDDFKPNDRYEGSNVIAVVLPRGTSREEMAHVTAAVKNAVDRLGGAS